MGVEFKKLEPSESEKLAKALRRNAEDGTPLTMDPLTTGWTTDDLAEDELLNAIASVPCHY